MVTIRGLDVMSAPTLHVFLAKADGKASPRTRSWAR